MAHRVCGYCRVSSREQAENSKALEQQIERVKSAGAEEVFVDVESGYKGKFRPRLEELLELVRGKRVEEVIITRLDRLSRKGVQSFAIFEDFLTSGVILRALDEPFDLSTPSGRMTAGVLVVVAQHHSDQKAESVKYGWKHLRSRRIAMNPPFGYKKADDKHVLDSSPFLCLIDDRHEYSKSEIARGIIDTFFVKQTLRLTLREINEKYGIQTFAHSHGIQKKGGRIAQQLFRFSPSGLRNWLLNPVLQGHLCYLRRREVPENWEIYYNTHPDQKLISDKEARQIQEILGYNKRLKKWSSSPKYPLSGLVYCGECRSACYSLKGGRGKNQPGYNYYYQCKNWRVRACSQKQVVRMELCEQAVITELRTRAQKIANLASLPDALVEPPELQQLRSQLLGLEQLGQNPAIAAAIAEVRKQIDSFQVKMSCESKIEQGNRDLLMRVFSDRSYWATLSDNDKREIYRALVEKVVVREGVVQEVRLKV